MMDPVTAMEVTTAELEKTVRELVRELHELLVLPPTRNSSRIAEVFAEARRKIGGITATIDNLLSGDAELSLFFADLPSRFERIQEQISGIESSMNKIQRKSRNEE